MAVFKPVDGNINFPDSENEVLEFWRENDIFACQATQNNRDACARDGREHRPFVFYEGPPTANGMPHPGHVLTRVIKDVFLRYKAMQGHDCLRKAGWDTHGLPVEIEVEKLLGIEGKEGIEDYGVEPFVKKCEDSVFKYSDAWRKMTERIGFWVDLDDPYVTYHQSYIESVWWVLSKFWDAGMLYHGHKIVPYCPRCGTALSSHELGQGYKEVSDPSVYVAFRTKGDEKTSLLAWTTTPWTLLSNVALAVGADYDYDYVKVEDETLILASALREKVMGKVPHEVVKTVKGSELVGMEYQQLFTYGKVDKAAFRVVAADFVGLDAGCGIVHIAPAFGEDDHEVGVENDLPVLNMVNPDGTFVETVEPWSGKFVKDCDKEIIKILRNRNQVLKAEQYTHDYPFCWRCDSPLIYYARPTWYISTSKIKEHMLDNNRKVSWLPEHIKDGRFGNFLESNIDWALSRERYWGTPLPIWKCEGCDYQTAIGSRSELADMSGTDVSELDLHRPYIDEIKLNCPKCSSFMARVPEVIDCWFDSGAMPFAQWGYPHREGSLEKMHAYYPANFITEAIDQTRGWFYSLLAIGTLLNECARKEQHDKGEVSSDLKIFEGTPFPMPYRRCLVLGHVCDEDGYKMSKSKGNYLDPWEIMDENGADAMRWYFYSNNQPWVSVRFFKEAVRDAQKDFMVRLRNVWQFFTIYANIDGFDPGVGLEKITAFTPDNLAGANDYISRGERPLLDRWILSKLSTTTRTVSERLEATDCYAACQALHSFVDSLSNWYVRRSRDRYWKSGRDSDKWAAYWTLYECLGQVSLITAPIIPFMAENMYRHLIADHLPAMPQSVHLHPWASANEADIDLTVETQMDLVREIASLGLSARAGQKLKVRQPLGEAIVILAEKNAQGVVAELSEVICDELNVKKLAFAENAEDYVSFEVKLNFKILGPKLGKNVKACAAAVNQMDAAEINRTVEGGEKISVVFEGGTIDLGAEDLDIRLQAREGYVAAQGGKSVVVIDTTISDELKREGLAREVINRIQGVRKELDLPFEARIEVSLSCDGDVLAAISAYSEMIASETLSTSLDTLGADLGQGNTVEIEKCEVVISLRTV